MNRIITMTALGAIALTVNLTAQAAGQKPDPHQAVKDARAQFEKENGTLFAGASVKAYDAVPAELRFNAPNAAGVWSIILPYAEDSRVRFLDAEFKDGQFVKGTLKVLGRAPENVDAKAFAELRAKFPMVAVKAQAAEKKTALLYPPTVVKPNEKPSQFATPGVKPVSRHLGALADALKRFGLKTADLGWRVTFKDAQGATLDLGLLKKDINDEAIYPGLRDQVEAKYPDLRGRFTKSRSIGYWRSGEVIYKGE